MVMAYKREHLAQRIGKLTMSQDGTSLVHEAAKSYFDGLDEDRKLERRQEGKSATKNYPYVSDAESECDRQIVYSLMNVPVTDPPDLQGRMNMETGRRVESMVGDFFAAAGYNPTGQHRVEIPTGTTVVVGRPDFLLTPPPDQRHLVEVKKVKVYALSDEVLRNGPSLFERGVRQGNLYVHAARLGLLGDAFRDADRLLLVWVLTEAVKGEPGLFAWWRDYKEELAEFDLRRLEGLHSQAKDGKLPIPPPPQRTGKRWNYTWGSWPCAWCSWRTTCYEDIPAEKRGKGEASAR